MSGRSPEPEIWPREEAISRLRVALQKLTDDEHSICQVASERGIFCHGFQRWPASEFDRRWRDAIGRSTHLSRAQMEELANIWQLAEQIRRRVGFACDAQRNGPGGCRGWDEFSDVDLAGHCTEILGQRIRIAGGKANPAAKEERPDNPAARAAGKGGTARGRGPRPP
jgi:hypothetical protein